MYALSRQNIADILHSNETQEFNQFCMSKNRRLICLGYLVLCFLRNKFQGIKSKIK